MSCLCHSKIGYSKCCEPYHLGKENPISPEKLMRSRYSAYAKGLSKYIMDTTHKDNPSYKSDLNLWSEEILSFSKDTDFRDLKVISSAKDKNVGEVIFQAILFQNDKNVSFQEKSQFVCENGKWLYKNGEVSSIDQ